VRIRQALIVIIAVLLVAACSGGDEGDSSTTSTTAATITTLGDSAAVAGTESDQSSTTSSTTTSTVDLTLSFPKYTIISREATDNGDIVVVLLDKSSYESLSDIDIHNVMSDLVEEYAPVYEAYLVETQAAADALFVTDPTDEQKSALNNGYVAKLEEGFRIVYEGPLKDFGVAILGS
jgi:UDP-N-acetylmuramyl tripeptide synthase